MATPCCRGRRFRCGGSGLAFLLLLPLSFWSFIIELTDKNTSNAGAQPNMELGGEPLRYKPLSSTNYCSHHQQLYRTSWYQSAAAHHPSELILNQARVLHTSCDKPTATDPMNHKPNHNNKQLATAQEHT